LRRKLVKITIQFYVAIFDLRNVSNPNVNVQFTSISTFQDLAGTAAMQHKGL
jgi:hypothetical protein